MSSFGEYLHRLRQRRRLTLGQIALQSGVSKATLSRWEKGIHLPRRSELVGVLDALNLSSQERVAALRLLEVPRAIHLERESAADLHLSLGDVLYALRQRSGKTQEEAAHAVNVSRSLYRQWENDDSRPSDAQLHSLGFALGASVEETVQLTTRILTQVPVERNREALLAHYDQTDLCGIESSAAVSLFLLTLLAGFKNLLRQDRADFGDLGLILAAQGSEAYYRYDDRYRAHLLYRQAYSMALHAQLPLHAHLARAVRALLPPGAGTALKPERNAIEKALAWRPKFANRAGEAYLLSIVACAMADENADHALQLGATYYALVAGSPNEAPYRLRDQANLLVRCGRPAEALTTLVNFQPIDRFREGLKYLDMGRALVALKSWSEANLCVIKARQALENTEQAGIWGMVIDLERSLSR